MKTEFFADQPISSVEEVMTLEKQAPFIQAVEKFEIKTGGSFETIPFPQKESFILTRLNQLVGILKVNSFWRDRLNSVGINQINNWNDWQRIPIFTRQDMHDHFTVSKDTLVIPWDKGGHKPVTSGGSTDQPIISIFRFDEFENIGKRAGEFWRRNVFKKHEPITTLNMFDVVNNWASHELVRVILQGIPDSNYFSCGPLNKPHVAEFFMTTQGVTFLAGLPHDYVHLIQMLKEQNSQAVFPQIRWISFGGDFMDALLINQLKELFPNAQMLNVYSSTQTNHLAVKIHHEDPHFRIVDETTLIEIVDESGNILPDGQPGRIIVTRLMGNGDQPLRLDLQDWGSIELPEQNDPLQARKLKLYGRTGGLIRIASCDMEVSDLLDASAEILSEKISLNLILARQIVADNQGIHLFLAVQNPNDFQLEIPVQQEIMSQVVLKAMRRTFDDGMLGDPDEWLRKTTTFSIKFVTLNQLIKTPIGKVHPFINQRK